MKGTKVDYLQTFLVRTGRTVGERKAHATIPDGIEGFITKRKDMSVKSMRTKQRGIVRRSSNVLTWLSF